MNVTHIFYHWATCVPQSLFNKARHIHKERHSAGMQCVLIWGRVRGVPSASFLAANSSQGNEGIKGRLIGAGLGLTLPAVASGSNSHLHGQCCS